MTILALQNVSKSYGALKVTQDVSFALEKGEALGIIGPNGAGKSTLFNLITGNVDVDDGRIAFEGRDVTRMPPMARCLAGVGRTFQIPQPFDKLTVFENLLVAGSFGASQSESEATDRCADILWRTGLAPRANDMAGGLSLLQRKRLELARALATRPTLLLLDEIAGGLTEGECGQLVDTIRTVHATGVSIVWIEHVLHALTAVVGRLLVLDFGKVIGIGQPDEIMASRAVREIYLGIDV
ncbi:ABC transporter ATP-binding protein [Labrys sp. WJW]|uniref:ABC transporter ATP-binding protein n=1 Tax=Labrys sp. WJW TaxID=1737983 RepID=UPI000834020E|nr:ABC transporter ATP-binding protein [Labrys sp. WJW]OCC07024.1 ABC transporter ATP-binding protein [Labrys sp. WJW]